MECFLISTNGLFLCKDNLWSYGVHNALAFLERKSAEDYAVKQKVQQPYEIVPYTIEKESASFS